MHPFDIVAIAVYLLLMLGLGIAFGRNQSRREFFVAGGTMGWLPVGLSVMATLFSSNSFVFYPSAAFGNSLRIGASLVAFALMTPVVIWVFVPVYARLKVETAYEYLELRFHVSVRTLASGLFVLLRIGWMASATYAASVVVSSVMGVSQTAVIVALGVVSVGYTMLGGLRAVMWTDVIQFFVFAVTIMITLGLIMSLTESGPSEIIRTYFDGREGLIVDFSPSMVLPYGTWVILIGVFLEAVSAFGVDQVAVQRFISARSERTAQWGSCPEPGGDVDCDSGFVDDWHRALYVLQSAPSGIGSGNRCGDFGKRPESRGSSDARIRSTAFSTRIGGSVFGRADGRDYVEH